MIMTGTHDGKLVALSILIAMFASFTALSLATRVRASIGSGRRLWLVAATVSLGGGIWAMHFVAMLAFSMPGMEMSYDLSITLLSLLIALIFTGVGFAAMDWETRASWRVALAGLLMGLGVVAMHYVGMTAMRMPATIDYDPTWVAISVLIAIGAATAAMWLASRDRQLRLQLIAAGVMGVAIAGMHYAGMHAAMFAMTSTSDPARSGAGLDPSYLALLISVVTVLILLMALGAARLERLLRGFTRREARIAMRLKIADVLRAGDTVEALTEVAALMGRHFDVSRTGYGQLDSQDDIFDYDVCWTDGTVAPLLGHQRAGTFGMKIVAGLQAGRTVAVDDLLTSDLTNEGRAREKARRSDTRGMLVVPFLRDGRLRTIVYLNDRRPRRWLPEDIAFMEELAERTRLVIERATVEEQLRELNATLEMRVEARTFELRQAQEALLHSQKLEAVGQLVAGLAHDFNNVLAAMVGAFDLIQRRAGDSERVKHFADGGLRAGERGAKLTAQLLAFSRSQRIQLEPLVAGEVIKAMRDLLERTLGPMIRLEVDIDGSSVRVMADPTQVEMTVLNLAINARDAMPDGGVLRIATALRQVTGDPELADGDYVEIAVGDTGTGMDEATLRRAMEPFFTTKPVGKGTGLGLAQIYGSARQAGGTARIESTLDAGTTVRVFLPRTEEEPRQAVVPDAATPGTAAGSHVLLVDDDDEVRTVLASAMETQGYRVTQAPDGFAALDLIAAEPPDAAVLDFAMPGMNGAELARRITEQWPAVPILFASGFSDTAAIEAAGTGKVRMLRKPFRVDELLAAVNGMVG